MIGRLALAIWAVVAAAASVSCASCPPSQNLVVFNQTGKPEQIEIRLDNQSVYRGLLGTVEYAPAIVINQYFWLPAGSHTLYVAVPGKQFEKLETFQVTKQELNLVVMVNRDSVQVNVSYGVMLYG